MGLILSEQGPAQLLVIERYELTFIFVTGFRTVVGPVKDRNRSEHQSVVFRFLCVEVASKGEPEIYLKFSSKFKKYWFRLENSFFLSLIKNFSTQKLKISARKFKMIDFGSKIRNDQFRSRNFELEN